MVGGLRCIVIFQVPSKSTQWLRRCGASKMALPITLDSCLYNSLYYRTSHDEAQNKLCSTSVRKCKKKTMFIKFYFMQQQQVFNSQPAKAMSSVSGSGMIPPPSVSHHGHHLPSQSPLRPFLLHTPTYMQSHKKQRERPCRAVHHPRPPRLFF